MFIDITEPVVGLLGIGLTVQGAAALSGESNLTSAVIVVAPAEASLSAESNLVSDATNVLVAASSLSAESALVAAATATLLAESALSAESNLTAGMQQNWSAAAAMSAEVTLSVAANIVTAAASLIVGTSNLVANGVAVRIAVTNPLVASSNLTATLLILAPVEARPLVFGSDLTATVYVPSKYLVLPTIELAYTDNVLLSRYPIDNGQALLITGTSGELLTFPAQEAIADADYYFRGGATNILDDESEAAVVAAGYGQYIVTQ
jgi:hypothetical protein